TITGRIGLLFAILDTTESDVRRALASDLPDFEDAVMIETALRENVDCIVTRNLSDYQNAPLPVYAPREFLNKLREEAL
ncbi:MAG: PIN domain-containing protein, partial [Clostridia bacterium]|nr:PIN domain-containing protein [Clostridia bacterium]